MRPFMRSTTLVREMPRMLAICCCVKPCSAAIPRTRLAMLCVVVAMPDSLYGFPATCKQRFGRVASFPARSNRLLVILTGMSYTHGMTNVTQLKFADPTRRARADFIKLEIEKQDRSVRYVAGKIGVNHTSLGDRLKGKVPFTAEDIERIASVLRRDPVSFYREYLAASVDEGVKLPEVDSNHQPAG